MVQDWYEKNKLVWKIQIALKKQIILKKINYLKKLIGLKKFEPKLKLNHNIDTKESFSQSILHPLHHKQSLKWHFLHFEKCFYVILFNYLFIYSWIYQVVYWYSKATAFYGKLGDLGKNMGISPKFIRVGMSASFIFEAEFFE